MPYSIKIIDNVNALREWRKSASGRVGFVPTMGALHAGHRSLLERVRPKCDLSVLSIFVNPTQFGPTEDLAKYPRTFESDLKMAEESGVDVVFAPARDQIYPEGYSSYIEETSLTRHLCGVFRPTHFRGVTTVVLKLFHLVRPEFAIFGLKDAQQFFVIRKMCEDLGLDVRVEGAPTIREADGLALSSRNVYLSLDDRVKAPLIYRLLRESQRRLELGEPCADVQADAIAMLTAAGFEPQYFECRKLPTLAEPGEKIISGQPYLLAAAAKLGTTRLIDNVILFPEKIGL